MASRTITTTAEELIPENFLRKSWTLQNEDASINIFIKKERPGSDTVSATDHDHRVGSGAAIALNGFLDGKESIQSRWTVVAASGTPRISIIETEENRR